jgi:antagonist of KipI
VPAFPRVRTAGEGALSLELGERVDLATSVRVHALDRELLSDPFPGLLEAVPTLAALLVLYDPHRASADDVERALRERLARHPTTRSGGSVVHEIPVRYGGADGPDLDEAAARLGMRAGELVRRHATDHTVLMLGFKPGFAYLGPLPAELELPRRATPRTRVPSGSVALAGSFTGIYPSPSPGGWNLIGRTAEPLFDPALDRPARLAPLDVVRFVATDEPAGAPRPPLAAPATHGPVFAEVEEGGALTTVQDLGRTGYRRYGVAAAGAMDPAALFVANRAVGNASGAAALECTITGPALRFTAAVDFAVAGADLGAVLWRGDLGRWPVPLGRKVHARPGNRLSFEGRRSGCRAYVAFAGGLDVPLVLGSRATDVGAGFGGFHGRGLCAGDVLRRVDAPPPGREEDAEAPGIRESVPAILPLRVRKGPQYDALDAESQRLWSTVEYRVSEDADRSGLRLVGPPLRCRGSAEVLSEAMAPGSIQVPGDGQPIVMGPEGPTTGGYVKPLVVVGEDLPKLGQMVPGETRIRLVAGG